MVTAATAEVVRGGGVVYYVIRRSGEALWPRYVRYVISGNVVDSLVMTLWRDVIYSYVPPMYLCSGVVWDRRYEKGKRVMMGILVMVEVVVMVAVTWL